MCAVTSCTSVALNGTSFTVGTTLAQAETMCKISVDAASSAYCTFNAEGATVALPTDETLVQIGTNGAGVLDDPGTGSCDPVPSEQFLQYAHVQPSIRCIRFPKLAIS